MKHSLLIGCLLLTLCSARSQGQTPAGSDGAGGFTGKVTETTNAAGYTYILVNTGKTNAWVAAPQFEVKAGDSVVVAEGMPMPKHHSKTLNRDFDLVYFSGRVLVNGAQPPSGAVMQGLPKDHPPIGNSAKRPTVDLTGIKKADGGKTIEEVFATQAKLSGETVKVRGKVVKYNEMILGKNWLHLRDGTGKEGSNDLLVTTATAAKVGDTVLATGKISLNKDFGSGYKYAVMLDDAKVTLAGTEGNRVTGRMIRDRLLREAEGNVALRVRESDEKDSMEVAGRGELQLGILIETMRREGFELSVSRPKVLLKEETATGETLEPIEEVVIDLDEEHAGIVVQKMAERKADMLEMRPSGGGRLRLVFHAPTRGLIGYQGELLTDTRGTAIMNRLFHAYAPYKGPIQGRRNGVLISNDQGDAVAYALWNLEDRGPMMIEPGWKVYNGMIVGEHTRGNDLIVNVLKGKKLTNIRTTSKDEAVRLTPPIRMTLEKALAYIEDDELVEVTPKSIRLRKKLLDENDRKKEERKKEAETV